MSQPTYRYSDTAITQGIEAIRIAHNRIDTALDELERYADTQLQAWDGNTRQTYNEYKASWDQSVNNMKDIMLRGPFRPCRTSCPTTTRPSGSTRPVGSRAN